MRRTTAASPPTIAALRPPMAGACRLDHPQVQPFPLEPAMVHATVAQGWTGCMKMAQRHGRAAHNMCAFPWFSREPATNYRLGTFLDNPRITMNHT
ncbi:thioredoxin reductase NTRC [Dorcoceras hygrometricum]|uniref:Thioredoxin reductase NTRC n=1 Tax=Dorcoceras hygrometricum TaxID=472368 RepID=A0A2Z6ZTM6_9LAMI|nr:thioredoxin reductase NTRC [Dorcoceras hygrometricum]